MSHRHQTRDRAVPYSPATTPPDGAGPRHSDETVRVVYAPDASGTPMPLVLQRRASETLRTHIARSLFRVSCLLASDLVVLVLLRQVLHAVRDSAILGSGSAARVATIIPLGSFPPGQLLLSVLIGLALLENYGAGDRRRDASAIVTGVMLGLALIHWTALWNQFSPFVVLRYLIATVVCSTALIAARLGIDWAVRTMRAEGSRVPRVVVIGPASELHKAMSTPPLGDPTTFALIGAFASDEPSSDMRSRLRALVTMLQINNIDTVMFIGSIGEDFFGSVLDIVDAAGCQVFSMPRNSSLWGVEPRLASRGGMPLIQLTRPALRARQLVLKRAFDLVLAGGGLLLLSPLYAGLAAAVWLSSPGPIFFRQERLGKGGKPFFIYKFRSMVVDAEAKKGELHGSSMYTDPRLFKMRNDPRVTPLGAFLRRTSMDELPQLWNVLMGTMSLVGPRPPIPSEVVHYEDHHYTRFELQPGITGPWQVSGRNTITDFEEIVRLETTYIRRWSFWQDLRILFRTVPAVLRMRGAH